MAELYKCISCGDTREFNMQCSCPRCGYTMFKTPYEKADILRSEIKKFYSSLLSFKVSQSQVSFYREVHKLANKDVTLTIEKTKDDERFPTYDKIVGYVSFVRKSEEFFERAKNALGQIKDHISTPISYEYKMRDLSTYSTLSELERFACHALKLLDVDYSFTALNLPHLVLKYSETPDIELLDISYEIIDQLFILLNKINKFIKVNNAYVDTHKERFNIKNKKNSPEKKHIDKLTETKLFIEKINNKKYLADIFSDGTDELREMYQAFWMGVHAILSTPILASKSIFESVDNDQHQAVDFDEFYKTFITERHKEYLSIINGDQFISELTEEELFEAYNKLIEIDTYGILVANKGALLKVGESEKQLSELIGLSTIKESIQKIKAYSIANKDDKNLNLHMCFYGNPGTGKTEVARIIAGILYENKILPTKNVVEVDRSGLVGEYVGETPQKTQRKIMQAMGGVLFIDEAYALVPAEGGFDYGNEAVATLIKAMEDYRGKFCVILAGYKNQMQKMISSNPGFKSRIQFELDFPNYSRDELKSITELMLSKRKYTLSEPAMEKVLDITDVKRKDPNFANAREIRNILDQVIMCQNLRVTSLEDKEIGIVDVNKYIIDSKICLPVTGEGITQKILSAEEELDQLVGLSSVKRMVKKIKAYAKRNKDDETFNMHMCFYGNPGTGKTEVARILSRILYDAGVLPESKLVETDANGLIGKYVGETAPKTEAKIQDAMGGVLFIDEAYSLNDGGKLSGSTGYGAEAIAVLIKDMEDYRGKFCVILAGYQNEMQNMINTNPGFESRIQFVLEFPDYSRGELQEIAIRFASKKKYEFDSEALALFLDVVEYYRNSSNFANARTVRNILDQVIMNQNLRAEDNIDDNIIILSDVEDYLADEKIDLSKPMKTTKIGFGG